MERLTARQLAWLRLVCRGCSGAQVASRLGLAIQTVKSHLTNAYRTLEAAGCGGMGDATTVLPVHKPVSARAEDV